MQYSSRKYRETSGELAKTKRELEEAQAKVQALQEIRDTRDAETAAASQKDSLSENCDFAADAACDADGVLSAALLKDDLGSACAGVDVKREIDDDAMEDGKDESAADAIKKEKTELKKEIKQEPADNKAEQLGKIW